MADPKLKVNMPKNVKTTKRPVFVDSVLVNKSNQAQDDEVACLMKHGHVHVTVVDGKVIKAEL